MQRVEGICRLWSFENQEARNADPINRLTVVQEPVRARMCGFGDKVRENNGNDGRTDI